MLFKITNNPIHPRSGACLCRMCWHVLLMVLWFLIGTRLLFFVELLTIELKDFMSPLVSFCNNPNDSVFNGGGQGRFKSRASAFLLA